MKILNNVLLLKILMDKPPIGMLKLKRKKYGLIYALEKLESAKIGVQVGIGDHGG
ncbi:MAG: hypothetical protein ACQEP4_01385 [Bacillota bacterium]